LWSCWFTQGSVLNIIVRIHILSMHIHDSIKLKNDILFIPKNEYVPKIQVCRIRVNKPWKLYIYNQFVCQFGRICQCQFVGMWGQQTIKHDDQFWMYIRCSIQKRFNNLFNCGIYLCVCLTLGNWTPCFIDWIKKFLIRLCILVLKDKSNILMFAFWNDISAWSYWVWPLYIVSILAKCGHFFHI
jgi:hypothetical protein